MEQIITDGTIVIIEKDTNKLFYEASSQADAEFNCPGKGYKITSVNEQELLYLIRANEN